MASYLAGVFGAVLLIGDLLASPVDLTAAKLVIGARKGEGDLVWRIALRNHSHSAYVLRDHGRGHLYGPVNEPMGIAVNGQGQLNTAV
jgi:hypothetical protein